MLLKMFFLLSWGWSEDGDGEVWIVRGGGEGVGGWRSAVRHIIYINDNCVSRSNSLVSGPLGAFLMTMLDSAH